MFSFCLKPWFRYRRSLGERIRSFEWTRHIALQHCCRPDSTGSQQYVSRVVATKKWVFEGTKCTPIISIKCELLYRRNSQNCRFWQEDLSVLVGTNAPLVLFYSKSCHSWLPMKWLPNTPYLLMISTKLHPRIAFMSVWQVRNVVFGRNAMLLQVGT